MSEQASKMWSGRFREPLDPLFEQWQRSLPFDWRLLPQEVAASKAHARTLAAASIFTAAEFETTVGGLDRVPQNLVGQSGNQGGGIARAVLG